MDKSRKLQIVADDYGYEHYEQMLNDFSSKDPSVPGICTTDKCNHIQDIPPARENDYCEECEEQSVSSILVLSGLIKPDHE